MHAWRASIVAQYAQYVLVPDVVRVKGVLVLLLILIVCLALPWFQYRMMQSLYVAIHVP